MECFVRLSCFWPISILVLSNASPLRNLAKKLQKLQTSNADDTRRVDLQKQSYPIQSIIVVLDLTPVRSLLVLVLVLVVCCNAPLRVGQETLTDGGGKCSRICGVGTLSEEEKDEKEKVRI